MQWEVQGYMNEQLLFWLKVVFHIVTPACYTLCAECRGRGMQTHKCAYSLTIINIPKSDHQKAVLNSNINWILSLSLIGSLNCKTHLWTCFTKMRVQPFIRFHLSDGRKLKLLSCYRDSDNPQLLVEDTHTQIQWLCPYICALLKTATLWLYVF